MSWRGGEPNPEKYIQKLIKSTVGRTLRIVSQCSFPKGHEGAQLGEKVCLPTVVGSQDTLRCATARAWQESSGAQEAHPSLPWPRLFLQVLQEKTAAPPQTVAFLVVNTPFGKWVSIEDIVKRFRCKAALEWSGFSGVCILIGHSPHMQSAQGTDSQQTVQWDIEFMPIGTGLF